MAPAGSHGPSPRRDRFVAIGYNGVAMAAADPAEMGANLAALGRHLGRPPCSHAVPQLLRFASLVQSWNAKMNLTAAREPGALVEVLFADALMLADPALIPEGARLADVGSGAGAPALPLLLMRPDLRGTLVEPLRKRVAFLRTAVGTLDLAARTRILESRVDPAAPGGGDSLGVGPQDLALSRATFAPEEWLRVGLLLAPRVLVLTAGAAPPCPVGAQVAAQVDYTLPSSGARRRVTAFERP